MAMSMGNGTGQGRTRPTLSEINITPFVDVVLVLLIIFMVTAPVLQSGIEVNVPKTKVVKEVSEERLVISITKGQEVYLGNDHVKLDELGTMLRQKIRDPRGQSVYVRADQDVAFGAFATVMSTVKSAGITNVSIVTEPIPPGKNK
ncbi:MAG TPA: biopolymer transporter ExbD [Candidatus Limnocylindrales bacterium]|jgi:biopolymer transport protein ExbD/biopolymer transport protein TolR|nr:biopolymer transporter ExbD [Candidatus Limnocylindrales bacterium]